MRNAIGSIKKVILISFAIGSNSYIGSCQEHQPPIPVEVLVGNEAVFSQLILNLDFTPNSKFSLFSLTTYTAGYNKEEYENDLVTINQITYDLGKGFGIMGGVNVNAAVGLTPVIGPEHVYVSRKFLAVSIFSYSVNGEHDISFFGLYVFTPPINEKISLYSRLQVLYNQSLGERQHNRSFMYLRVGLKRNKFNFGFGTNLDQYGPDKDFTDNYGAFVGWDF
jgi:hypothetical protein